jgi:hypothetical protein
MVLRRLFSRDQPRPAGDLLLEGAADAVEDLPPDDDIDALMKRLEAEALEVFARHGLPGDAGIYRRAKEAGSWEFLGSNLSVAERWSMVLAHPPEEGWRYVPLSEIGRLELPHVREVMAAVRMLETLQDARRALLDESGGTNASAQVALKAGMRLAFSLEFVGRATGRRLLPFPAEDSTTAITSEPLLRRRSVEERHWHWRNWRAEAEAIWASHPRLTAHEVAVRVKRNLRLSESLSTVSRRINQPVAADTGAATDPPTR